MEKTKIYHNPRCGTSRKVLAALESKGLSPEIIEYLKNPPSETELDAILKMMNAEPEAILRKKEDAYPAFAAKNPSRKEWLKILSENPILIERPIVVKGSKAVLARPPENLEKLFRSSDRPNS